MPIDYIFGKKLNGDAVSDGKEGAVSIESAAFYDGVQSVVLLGDACVGLQRFKRREDRGSESG